MCNQLINKCPHCSHPTTDTFPCEKSFSDGPCPEPSTETKETNTLCPDCLENQHLEDALKKIAEDDSLKPVPRTNMAAKDPNAPKVFLRYRDHFTWCHHYANYKWLNVEAEVGEEPFITDEVSYYCPGCASTSEDVIKEMKAQGKWDGNPDPWGEEGKTKEAAGSSKTAMVGSSHDHGSPKGDSDEEEEEGGMFDESQAKNKHVPGRPGRYDHPVYQADEEEEDYTRPPPGRPGQEGYSSDEGEEGYRHTPAGSSDGDEEGHSLAPTGPPRGRPHQRGVARGEVGYAHSQSPVSHYSDERSQSPPDWSSSQGPPHRGHTRAGEGEEGEEDPDAQCTLTQEQRRKMGLPMGPLTNRMVQRIMERKAEEGLEAMRQFSSGGLE